MKIALVGWGVETKSAYTYYGDNNDYLIVSEEPRDDFPDANNVSVQTLQMERKPGLTGNVSDLSYLEGLENHDLVIFTPAAHKNLEKVYEAESVFWTKAKTSLEVFFENCPTKNVIGVTGTKGKGTTTTLSAKLLQSAGKTVHIGGNIGVAVLDLLPKITENDWVCLELSSFQLYKFKYSPHISIHLMMVPEHIEEWHKTMDDYVQAKRNIFANQSKEDIAIYHPKNQYSTSNAQSSPGLKIPYLQSPGAYIENDEINIEGKVIIPTSQVGLRGGHNLENICAALTAAWQVEQDVEAYKSVIADYTGNEHRLQLIGTVNGVGYFDDSYGTTPDTSPVAMDAFIENKIMIVGGHDKGNDFTQMINRLNNDDIRHIICLGITGERIASELKLAGLPADKITQKDDYNDWTMTEIVKIAHEKAEPGDVVLLSTGSASFGIFKNYQERGNQFIETVKQL